MGLNFKKITDVPVVDSVGDGDTLLLNAGGVAKQVPANKFSTSGGGGIIYGLDSENPTTPFLAYADEGLTQPLTYAEGKAMIMNGAGAAVTIPVPNIGNVSGKAIPTFVTAIDTDKVIIAGAYVNAPIQVSIFFSDSVVD